MANAAIGVRVRACKVCGKEFEYEIRRGTDRKYCGRDCLSVNARIRFNAKVMPPCSVDGCGKSAQNMSCGYCAMHYARIRRTGRLEIRVPDELVTHSGGYKLLYSPGHPLTARTVKTRVYEHRAVYYEHNGDGPFECVHCGVTVTWDTMHVDHLDDDPANNNISNLGASCPRCNTTRSHWKVKRTQRARSRWQVTWNGVTKHVGDWAEQLRLPTHTLKYRLERWPLEMAMTQPLGPTGPRGRGGRGGRIPPLVPARSL